MSGYGRWILHDVSCEESYECSECGTVYIYSQNEGCDEWRRCPRCGSVNRRDDTMYMMTLTGDQLRLIHEAIQLQIRVRNGQGVAVIQNIVTDNTDRKALSEVYGGIVDTVVSNCAFVDKVKRNDCEAEYDIWKSISNALKGEGKSKDPYIGKLEKDRQYVLLCKVCDLLNYMRAEGKQDITGKQLWNWIQYKAVELGIIQEWM